MLLLLLFFFFFKQKTAYEMRISDWSSDVCSSDLRRLPQKRRASAALFIVVLILEPGIVDAVDPARRLAPREAARNRERVGGDRRIDIDLPAPAEAARVLDREAFDARAHFEFARVGLDGDIFDEAADRAGAIERALRALQHLDALDRKSTRLNSSH